MTSEYDFEKPLAVLSPDQSIEGQDMFVQGIIQARKRIDPDIYSRIVVARSTMAPLFISLSIIILIVIFCTALYEPKETSPEFMTYGSIIVIGLLISAGVSL